MKDYMPYLRRKQIQHQIFVDVIVYIAFICFLFFWLTLGE